MRCTAWLLVLALAATGQEDPLALHRAAHAGDLARVKLLITIGADVNNTDSTGRTPLHYAAGKKHHEIAKLLPQAKADPSVRAIDGTRPLHAAARQGALRVAELLLQYVDDVNPVDRKGRTPLDEANTYGHKAVSALLIKRGGATGATLKQDPFRGLFHWDHAVRLKTADKLAERGTEVVPDLLHAAVKHGGDVAAVLWRLGAAAEVPLIDALKSSDLRERAVAVRGLGLLPGMTAARFGVLVQAMADPDLRGPVINVLREAGWRLRPLAKQLGKEVMATFRKHVLEYMNGQGPAEQAVAIHAVAALGKPFFGKDRDVRGLLAAWKRKKGTDRTLRLFSIWALQSLRNRYPGMSPHVLEPERSAKLLRREPQVAGVIKLGLSWLAARQKIDGHWETAPNQLPYNVGVTALAVSAFLGPGGVTTLDVAQDGRAQVVKKGIDWLLSRQHEELIGSGHSAHYLQALATTALAQAYSVSGDPIYVRPLILATAYARGARNPKLGWGYRPRDEANNTSLTVMMASALKQAWFTGMPLEGEAMDGPLEWIEKMTDPDFGRCGYDLPGGSPMRTTETVKRFPPEKSQSLTAAGMRLRLLAGEDPRRSAIIRKGLDLCLEVPPVWNPDDGSIDMYYWWHASDVFHLVGGSHERKWNKHMRAAAQKGQRADGRWPGIGAWGMYGGDVYATALMVMCLQAPFG